MENGQIEPPKVTKPIQLLAAWLAGLVLIDGSFLGAAATISAPDWAASALVIAAIVNVPVFLICLFILQTRFRPEMQEDVYYSQYLESQYSYVTRKEEVVAVPTAAHRPPRGKFQRFRKPHVGLDYEIAGAADPPVDHEALVAPVSDQGYIGIQINDLLPSYSALALDLRRAGLRVTGTFGTTSNRAIVPKRFVVAIGDHVPASVVQVVVRIASRHGLEGIARVRTHDHPELYAGGLFLGGYGYEDPSDYVQTTQTVLDQVLSPAFNDESLSELIDS